jgi:hypothetical protein
MNKNDRPYIRELHLLIGRGEDGEEDGIQYND